jgi:hypothetical protein
MPALCKTLLAVLALSAGAASASLGRRAPVQVAAINAGNGPEVAVPGLSAAAVDTKSRVYPTLYTVFPQLPDEARPPVGGIHMEAYQNLSQVEQVAVFRGVPAGARNCALGLHQADKPGRVFVASPKGKIESLVTNIQRMTQLPDGGNASVSWASIQGLWNDAERIGAFDFNGWDIATYGKWQIGIYAVPCAAESAFRLSLRQLAEEKNVYMQQDEANGYFFEYEL